MSDNDRKQELERKKLKLAAIRSARMARLKEKESTEAATDKVLESVGIVPVKTVVENMEQNSLDLEQQQHGKHILEEKQVGNGDTNSKKEKKLLSMVSVHTENIAPREIVLYTKSAQTEEGWGNDVTQEDDEAEFSDIQPKLSSQVEISGSGGISSGDQEVTGEESQEKRQVARNVRATLTEEEILQVTKDENFRKFLSVTSKLMEVAITEDIARGTEDYSEDLTVDDESKLMSVNKVFYDEKWSKGRPVTSLDWSPKFGELVLSSHANKEMITSEAEGVCLVWNMKYRKLSPEYIFTSESPVVCARFSMFHPNLVVGTAYSGQVMLWDNRYNKRSPVQRSRFSPKAHTSPVYCAKVVGSQNANTLVTISTDGKLCSWSLDMLTEPLETLEMDYKKTRDTEKISSNLAPTCLEFQENDANNFIVGCENGSAYTSARHGSKAGVQTQFRGHDGPITGVSIHDSSGPVDYSHLFITSSMDWTIRLWSVKERRQIHSFENCGDYVMDCAWSPIHPAMFASTDVTGSVEIWDLNSSIESPTAVCKTDCDISLNKVSWATGGLNLAAGDDTGRVWVLDLADKLAVPGNDAWSRMGVSLMEMTASNE